MPWRVVAGRRLYPSRREYLRDQGVGDGPGIVCSDRSSGSNRFGHFHVGLPVCILASAVLALVHSALLEVPLMVFLCPVELLRRQHPCNYLPALEALASLEPLEGRLRSGFLAIVVVEYDGPVLLPHVRPLSVQRCRVMQPPEQVQEVIVGDLGWVILHLDDLCMMGLARAHIPVCGVLHVPTRVSGGGAHDSLDMSESLLDMPETSRSESGYLCHDSLVSSVCTENRCARAHYLSASLAGQATATCYS